MLMFQDRSIFAEPTYLDWHSEGKNTRICDRVFNLSTDPASNAGEMAEISVSHKFEGTGSPLDADLYYVLRRGDSGPYVYVVLSSSREGDGSGRRSDPLGEPPKRQGVRHDQPR